MTQGLSRHLIALTATLSWWASDTTLAGNTIEFWTRTPGQYADDAEVKKGAPKSVDQSSLKTVRVKLRDSQYKRNFTFQAIKFKEMIDGYTPSDQGTDTMLLHFKNGMAVPVPRDSGVLDKLYLATSFCEGKGACSSNFPELAKNDPLFAKDPRPLKFSSNKLVSLTPVHPYVNPGSNFSPWNHVDTLTGVEFIREAAYFDQFSPGGPEGSDVFKNRCAYCHSVKHVGGRFGWDFVDPLPVYTLKTPQNLFFHVKYPKAHALNAGLLMPNQKDINEREAKVLWEWMKQLATKPLKAYM